MTKEQLAEKLNGNQYGSVIDRHLAAEAKKHGLVVVYGASDDLMEFDGAIYDEVGCYDGGEARLTADGLFDQTDCDSECKYFLAAKEKTIGIKAIWGEGDYSWQYETVIPHATFEIYEDEEKYCRGIVFSMADLKSLV